VPQTRSEQGQEMNKIILETVLKDTYFFINTDLGQHLPGIQLVSFLPETHISSE